MRARARLIATAPTGQGRAYCLARLKDAAPVVWRDTGQAVYLVSTAATPAGDDVVEIDVSVQDGARLRVRSTAATVVWRSTGTAQLVRACVADGGALDWHLEPLIAAAGCQHRQHVRVALNGSARLAWTEEIVLGRLRERPGCVDLRLDVELDGQPLLRHQLTLGSDTAWDGPAMLGPHRFAGLALQVWPDYRPSSASGSGWARLPLEGPGALSVAVADDVPQLRGALQEANSAG